MAGVNALPIVAEDARSRTMYLVLALFLIAMVALVGMQWWLPVHGGVDENGYLVAGRVLAEEGTLALRPKYGPDGEVPSFIGDMWVGVDLGTASQRYFTKYPPGVPALMALAMAIGGASWGPTLAYLLNPAGYCAGLLGSYFLVRRLAGSLPAMGAILCIACSGPVVRLFTIPGSHGISFGVLTWALYLLVRWVLAGGIGSAIGAGLLCGFGGVVRTGEIALLAPLLVAAIARAHEQRSRRSLLEAAALLLAWGIPVGLSAAIQVSQMGSWSAYATTGEGSAFSARYFFEHLWVMLISLTWRGIFLAFPAGLLGIVLMLWYQWRLGAVLLTWVSVNIVLYTSYYWAPLNNFNVYSRFFLPAYPALLAGSMALFIWPAGRGRSPRLAVTASLLLGIICGAVTIYSNLAWARLEVITRNVLEQRILWLEQRVPPDSVLLCDELDMLNHLQFASNLMLYDFRLFSEPHVAELAHAQELNSLAPARKEYLRREFLSRKQQGLTEMRDRMIAAHKSAGRRVFVFSGPLLQWSSWDSLAKYGLAPRLVSLVDTKATPLLMVPTRWMLLEIVPATQ